MYRLPVGRVGPHTPQQQQVLIDYIRLVWSKNCIVYVSIRIKRMGCFIVHILAYKLLIIKLLTVFSSLHYTKNEMETQNENRNHTKTETVEK